mmetsp:Transcript_25103/g.54781  ORF Transcript_25103/g.54781 Transcript_25103/m.54781 type:complete len:209 (+) Transcript_25103:266-892(+)
MHALVDVAYLLFSFSHDLLAQMVFLKLHLHPLGLLLSILGKPCPLRVLPFLSEPCLGEALPLLDVHLNVLVSRFHPPIVPIELGMRRAGLRGRRRRRRRHGPLGRFQTRLDLIAELGNHIGLQAELRLRRGRFVGGAQAGSHLPKEVDVSAVGQDVIGQGRVSHAEDAVLLLVLFGDGRRRALVTLQQAALLAWFARRGRLDVLEAHC